MRNKLSLVFNKVLIVGVGLIGGSIGAHLVQRGLAREVIGTGRDLANLKIAKRRRLIHRFLTIKNAAELWALAPQEWADADLVILASPIQAIHDFIKAAPQTAAKQLNPQIIFTDVASTKQSIVQAAQSRLPRFVGGHPIAGTEQHGAQAALLDLFAERSVVLTPGRVDKAAVQRVQSLWEMLGAQVLKLTPAQHDKLLAYTSHLPHMLSYSLMQSLPLSPLLQKLAGPSLQSMTRVSASDPRLWREISLDNRKALLAAMENFEKEWLHFKHALQAGDVAKLESYLRKAQAKKKKL